MLKRKKGFNIVTKSKRCKLLRNGFDLLETKKVYNDVVLWFFLVINEDPQGVVIPVSKDGGWRYYERKILGDEPEYEFPWDRFPSPLRRSAIRKAIGAWTSWHSSFVKWKNRPKRQKHHRPPKHPSSFNFSPSFDVGASKNDDGYSICLKILVKGQWKWIKFSYQAPPVSDEWVKGSPSVICKRKGAYITFPLEKYIPATGGAKKLMAADYYRVCGVDMDLNRHIAILSILEIDAKGQVCEIARHFINQTDHIKRRKRDLGLIATRMRSTGIVHKGFCSTRWQKISRREVSVARYFARRLVNFAHHYGACLIAFEHLGNLKPIKGKYSRLSNQKRAYWLKSKLFEQVRNIAYNDYGLLTLRVNPKDTSRQDPWGNLLWRGNDFPTSLLEYLDYQQGANYVATTGGYKAHSGLNAARNIGLKAIRRHRTNPTLLRRRGKP